MYFITFTGYKFKSSNSRNKVMYAKDVVEIEVKSTEEACAQLWRGQERRRKAATILNDKSSRSHSVFNIRLVQVGLSMDSSYKSCVVCTGDYIKQYIMELLRCTVLMLSCSVL